ncbi:hypothetical protein JD844_001048 [Phrynosoma platyrhinos]|uniref:Ig-like domain-containing protein n=1 Tax=Phrynosoma platyrhinos TaxID=52577 RepID=A0ABQ7T9U5_PHRPL|nr:hypothetical protein JD844_001048 [Phrynosoma platyrhinos]
MFCKRTPIILKSLIYTDFQSLVFNIKLRNIFSHMMKSLLFLFTLVAVPRWAFSDIQLVPTGPGMVRPGENLRMVCKVTGFSIASSSSYAWYWIRQHPGKSFEAIAGINANNGGTWYAPSLRSRTTISADSSKNEFSLLLNSLTAADSAVYFCVRQNTMRQSQLELCTKRRNNVTLSQDSFMQLKPTETLRLTCSVSGFSLTAYGYRVSWIRQPTEKGLEWFSAIDWEDDTYFLDTLKNRLTISRDVSKSEVYLEMRDMDPRDTGMYYCARDTQCATAIGNLDKISVLE